MASMKSPDIDFINFILRLLIAVGSFLSITFKIPSIIFALDFALKLSKGRSSGGDVPPEDQPPPDAPKVDILEVGINVIILLSLFISVIIVLIHVIHKICLGRVINVYSYLIIMGLWLGFLMVSIMTDGWEGPLNYAILGTRSILIGWYVFPAPATWHFILLRASIIIDILTYPAMIGIAILSFKYNFFKVGSDVGVWTRYNNLIRTL